MKVSSSAFIDTNVLVYTYDERTPHKHAIAIALVDRLVSAEQAVISSQVVQEFCNVALNKIKIQDVAELEATLATVILPLLQHYPTPAFYQRTIQLHERFSLSFYDALIIQAALDLKCSVLYSEDLQDGQTFGSLKIVDPFH